VSASTTPRPPGSDRPGEPGRPLYVDRLAERLGSGSLTGLVAKLAFLCIVNGLALYAVMTLLPERAWTPLVVVVLATAAIDVVYLSRRALPLKFLVPGTLVLLMFQVYPVLYTGYIAFTNYGTGNILTQSQAVERIVSDSITVPEGSTRYALQVLVDPTRSSRSC
jgi:arabinogalactan oligomer / maltooligosaccharide transport system permease protein